ncbi:MAG: GGDEF domain-containing protein [Rhodobacteraceae bacterium]|nr:GGDEF domain-containing protein [Paracoccaceae bacterium]
MTGSTPGVRAQLPKLAAALRGQTALVAAPALMAIAFETLGRPGLYGAAAGFLSLAGAAWLPVALSQLRLAGLSRSAGKRARLIAALEAAAGDPGRAQTVCILLRVDDPEKLRPRLGTHGIEDVLEKLAERLRLVLRPADTVQPVDTDGVAAALAPAARYDLETGLQIAARLQACASEPLPWGQERLRLSISVGICLSGRLDQPTGADILAGAEQAADVAQRSGAGSIRVHSTDQPAPAAPDPALVETVLEALEAGQIRPWFQPQLCNDTGEVSGFEALARWHHPERGVLGPGEFLPAIEAAGRMERLGEVIRRQSLTALKAWDRARLAIPTVGINVSLAELRNPAFAEKIAWEIDGSDLDPGRLTLEVLESVISEGCDDVVSRNIMALSSLGCPIDLDDFGTGHASITSMRRFPVGRIKIDRSFVTGVDTDREQQRMVAAIVTMAERLDLKALAEGVESAAEHAMLAQLGCSHVQGFGIGRPMPFEDTLEWVSRHRSKLPRPAPLRRNLG